MFGNNVLGIIFAYAHEERVRDLTELRVMASVPFGGRYRLVDFTLSNMVNSGLNKVGIITEDNYQSLMDHLGSGQGMGPFEKARGSVPAAAVRQIDFENRRQDRIARFHSPFPEKFP